MAVNLKFRGQKTKVPATDSCGCNFSHFRFIHLQKQLGFGVVVITAFVCYWNSLNCDLVHDDIFAIKDNMDIRQETPLRNMFLNDFWGKPMSSNISHKSYRPLCTLTFRINFAIHELRPFGYHLVNVMLHCFVCLIYTHLCEKLVFQSTSLAVLAGLFFATHPVHTEAVTGVVGRADVMACLFFLLSFLAFVRSANDKVHCFKENMYLFFSLLLGFVAMLVKEHGITVFGVCFVYDYLVLNKKLIWRFILDKKSLPEEATMEKFKPLLIRTFILLTVVFCLLGFRFWMLGNNLPYFTKQDNPASFSDSLSTRVMTFCYLATFNFWLLLSPTVLSYDWQMGSIPLVESLLDIRNLATIAFFTSLFVLSFFAVFSSKIKHEEQDVLVLSLALMCIPFLPASNIFFRVGFVVAERILYIPSMGFCILIVHGLHKLVSLGLKPKEGDMINGDRETRQERRCSPNSSTKSLKERRHHKAVLLAAASLIVLFCWKTVVRNRVWRNRETLFKSGIETLPYNAKAHYNYANFLKDAGKDEDAIHHYTTALKWASDHVSAHNNLGTLLNDDEEAMQHFRQAIKYDPYHANAYFNLGMRLRSLKRLPEAEAMLREAVRLNPTYLDAMLNLASVLSDREKFIEAEELLKKTLTIDPKSADAHYNYAVFLGKIGRPQDSITNYKTALKLNPNHSVAVVNMARQLRGVGKIQEAEQAYLKALSIRREASTLHLLGVLYYHSERLQEAELAWREAIELEPSNIETRSNYVILLDRTNRYSEAVRIQKGLVLDDPHNPGHYKTLSGLHAQNGRIKEGLQVITSALSLPQHAENADLHFHLGSLYKDLNDMEEAKKSFERAIQLDPNHFSAHLNLGVIFHLEGNLVSARRHYEIAAKLDPSNVTLRQNMAKLFRAEERRKP